MIVLHVKALAEKQGKTVASLSEETSLAYNTVLQLFRGSVSRVDFKTLDALCLALHVQPGALLSWVPETSGVDRLAQSEATRANP